ncbi:MAG: biotin/lipoyl-binding protein, partial [Candidatus Omnitrophica bacterium]|nr:biotin/lipoyl-binding protein [Candidatus Omnitrophota bacterium]
MNKKPKIFLIIIVILVVVGFFALKMKPKAGSEEIVKEINPTIGSIETFVSTTGTVLPMNRLEIKPPVNGRVESILIKEGEKVKVGQNLAWMSSTERAALLDAAHAKGPEQLKYWQEA